MPGIMVKFRPQRGGLAEAMAEMVDLSSLEMLINHLRERHAYMGNMAPKIDHSTVHVQAYGNGPDERIGWKQTHIVMIDGWGPAGFTDGDFTDIK